MTYRVVSLFSGSGGKDFGFRHAGFDVVWANDIDVEACQTLERNLGSVVVNQDIRLVKSVELPEAHVVIGGFPCQGFSVARSIRHEDDERNFLYLEMLRVVRDLRPAVFVAENVRGILSLAKGRVIARIKEDFENIGYTVDVKLLDAVWYGVPQKRERVFIVGNNMGVPNLFPAPTHANQANFLGLPLYRTVRDSIGDLVGLGGTANHQIMPGVITKVDQQIMQRIGPGQKLCNNRHAWTSVRTWDIEEVFGHVGPEEKRLLETIARNRRLGKYAEYRDGDKVHDANPLSVEQVATILKWEAKTTEEIMLSLAQRGHLSEKLPGRYDITKANYEKYRRIAWDKPCYTVQPNFGSPRYYVHPSENRPLSVRECARLQSFPDDFVFKGSFPSMYLQVGNAVPPVMAYRMACCVRQMLDCGTSNKRMCSVG